ncbi:segregation/condensation protein A [Streptomyces sp. 8N706]|uniref:segregation/condensation protein A n=1 Tax=Streptomyces sp. 8N706 TaxID=3457416 RepID=UPI003FD43DF1
MTRGPDEAPTEPTAPSGTSGEAERPEPAAPVPEAPQKQDGPRPGGPERARPRPGAAPEKDAPSHGRPTSVTHGGPAPVGREAAASSPPTDGPAIVPVADGTADGGRVAMGPDGAGSGLAGGLPAAGGAARAVSVAERAAGGGPAAEAEQPEGEEPEGEEATGRFTVRLANFEGPFDLLLQLISKHKLDVTEVALSKVTDEFMAHIRAMGPDWDLDQTTEFLVVAATLLDLKAARLLPSAEVEDEADLALLEARDLLFARLLQYRAYKQIADIFSERLATEARRYPRTVGLEPHHAELLPEVVISIGAEGFAKLAVKAMQPKAEPQVYVDHIHAPLVSVREQGQVMIARLRELGEASFRSLTEDAPDTLTVVARFLALLELYRERAVVLDQEEALGSLMVRWTGGAGEQPMVTDEFDQPPGERLVEEHTASEREKA